MDVFGKSKFYLAVAETETEGVLWGELCVGMERNERRREIVLILMNDLWHRIMVDFFWFC